MPLLYGEGSKAFHRLQLELLKSSDDESIFVWAMTGSPINGVLAPKPASFGMLPKYIANSFVQWNTETPRHAYTVTNKGLEIHVPWHLAREDCFLLPLNCIHYSGELYAIALRRIGRYWCRVMVDSLEGLEYLGEVIARLNQDCSSSNRQSCGIGRHYVRQEVKSSTSGWAVSCPELITIDHEVRWNDLATNLNRSERTISL